MSVSVSSGSKPPSPNASLNTYGNRKEENIKCDREKKGGKSIQNHTKGVNHAKSSEKWKLKNRENVSNNN